MRTTTSKLKAGKLDGDWEMLNEADGCPGPDVRVLLFLI